MKAEEIKFKGIRVDNGECVYGDLVHYFSIKNGERTDYVSIGIDLDLYDVIPETVCQFTGLKDKNGIEIYEGDICNNCNETGVITWLDDYASYGLREYKDGQIISDRYPLFRYYELEVIGNTHDKNKE